MKVIFIKDLKKQGRVNDIKEVSDGYATNFLIKNGYAVKYTKTSSQILDNDIKKSRDEDKILQSEALELKKKLDELKIEFRVTSHNGRMFGSISTKQISDELKKQGFKIDKKNIILSSELNSLGVHEVQIRLYKKVSACLRVSLLEK